MWFQIKTPTVAMNHLKKYNIWVYIDEFETRRVGSLDFITELHPKLTDLAALAFELEQRMRQVDCNNEHVIKKWKERNNIKNEAFNTIPKFVLLKRMKCWGEIPRRIESWAVMIQSVAEDAALINCGIQRLISDPNYFNGVCCQPVTTRNSQMVNNIPTIILV
eukprot:6770548-Ditylum_brightwellii.AAC.2